MGNHARGKRRRGRLGPKRRSAPGTPPGTLSTDPSAPKPQLHVIAYGPDNMSEAAIDDPGKLRDDLGRWPVTWLNVDGLGDATTVKRIGDLFGLHPLALEDVVNVHQRPKVEPYADHLFIVLRMPSSGDTFATEQISLFLGGNFVLTFQEKAGDPLDKVRRRIREGRGRVRTTGADYLAYAILDAVVDHFFPIVEAYGDRLDRMEDDILSAPATAAVVDVHNIRHDLLGMRRAIRPLRDVLGALLRDETQRISEDTKVYIRDCLDHSGQLLDAIESYLESSAWLVEAHISNANIRTNDAMRVLTVIATIFIPLTFIAGIYGMNFDPSRSPLNMPELTWYWGYPFALFLMAVTAGAFFVYFRRKAWL